MRFHRMTSQIGPLVMLGAGLGFAIAAVATLDLGSARRMGPGAFPLLVHSLSCTYGWPLLMSHWGTFNLGDEPPAEPPARFRAAARAAGYSDPQAWVLRIGETRLW